METSDDPSGAWPPLLARVVSIASLPVYAVQGAFLRRRVLRLPPAAGPRDGQFGASGSAAAPFRLLVIGDSSAASVGIDRSEDGLAAQLARVVHERTGRAVRWRSSGHNSAVAGQIRDHVVPHVEPRDWTHILVTIGTNDTKNFHSLGRFKREFGALLYALHARFPQARIYWSQAIDPRRIPHLPEPLATIMWLRRNLINAKGRQLCHERGAVAVRPIPDVMPAGFAIDGFHASEDGYAAWAETVAEAMLADEAPITRPEPA